MNVCYYDDSDGDDGGDVVLHCIYFLHCGPQPQQRFHSHEAQSLHSLLNVEDEEKIQRVWMTLLTFQP